MDQQILSWLIPIIAGAGIVALWIGVSFGISGMGWRAFATRYPAIPIPAAPRYSAWSARFNSIFASYRNVVRVAFLREGMHFSMLFLFRAGHDPFTLPWASVVRAEIKQGLVGKRFEIEVDDPAGNVLLWLPPAAEPAIRQYLRSPPPAA